MIQKTTACNENHKSYIESKNADKKKSYLMQKKRKGGKICEKENFVCPINAVLCVYGMRSRKRRKHGEYG